MADPFPEEVIYGIFSRLPIKSLARFQCACKLWLKYIKDPYLLTIHHVKEEPTPIMLVQYPCLPLKHHTRRSEISFLRVIRGAVREEHVLEFLTYKSSTYLSHGKLFFGSCNGLILVFCERVSDSRTYLFAVINPLNKQRHNLPPIKLSSWAADPQEAAGIGFDDSINTLKTVCVIYNVRFSPHQNVVHEHLYTMVHDSGMRSWREIPQIPDYPIYGEGIFAHGRLHWLVSCKPVRSLNITTIYDEIKIVWFDLKMEKFGLTDPLPIKPVNFHRCQLVNLNGEVGYAYINAKIIELWILKQEGWGLHCSIGVNLSWFDVAVSGYWNKDGDILLTCCEGKQMFVYIMKTGHYRQLNRGDVCEAAEIRMYESSLFLVQHKCLFN